MANELNNTPRSYEVSVWTLQDSFIAVLKWSELGVKGTIQEPKLTLNVDGTQNLSFNIPMKLYINGEWRENPIWHNTTNGDLLVNMRKIKVIFNKKTEDEEVFEFLITKITMKHAQDNPSCEVECENGLAYHELGKQGYRLELSSEVYENKAYEIFQKGDSSYDPPYAPGSTLPNNIQYWCEEQLGLEPAPYSNGKVAVDQMDPRKWYYDVRMDWSSFSDANNRNSKTIYEEEYVSSWTDEGQAATIESYREKWRKVDEKDSNLYNLTQTLATTFNVYCRYEYLYDNNYCIIGKLIIFYNNFLTETTQDGGIFQFQYPYTTTEVSREVDSTDVVTKMYVDMVEGNTAAGSISITDTEANKMMEDYLLNFDYLYEAGTITEDQYALISQFENDIREANKSIIPLQNKLMALEDQKVDYEAKRSVADNARTLAINEIENNSNLRHNLTAGDGKDDGVIERGTDNPDTAILKSVKKGDTTSYYIDIQTKGILSATVTIYAQNPQTTSEPTKIKGKQVTTKDGNLIKIENLTSSASLSSIQMVYLTYKYQPKLYYDNVEKEYKIKQANEEAKFVYYNNELTNIETQITSLNSQLSVLLQNKAELIKDFELAMGPALREGHWTPEDYSNYGDKETANLTLNINITSGAKTEAIWDDKLFASETHNYYQVGINQNKVYYPIIVLSGRAWGRIINWVKEEKIVSLVFNDCSWVPNPNAQGGESEGVIATSTDHYRVIALGSGMEVIFIKLNNEIKPALMITESSNMPEEEIAYIQGNLVSRLTTMPALKNEEQSDDIQVHDGPSENVYNYWLPSSTEYTQRIPRILIHSLNLMNNDKIAILYGNHALENYKDYSVLLYSPEDIDEIMETSGEQGSQESQEETSEEQEESEEEITILDSYSITINSLSLLKYSLVQSENNGETTYSYSLNFPINIQYYISNASTSIYLDATTIMKENAYPKLSYSLTPNVLNIEIHRKLYSFLTRIININDTELKLHDAYGYISELELDLDQPWNDSITVQNYKNKFEDIFSTITAQTQDMQRREFHLNETMEVVDVVKKSINPEMLQDTMNSSKLNYDFNDGTLTFTETDGITGLSDDGIITIRGSGIFTANTKDDNGNWIWNSAILPNGINANLIKAGQLDTQKILIYSGNDVKFQWNSNGIYAYEKDYRENSDEPYNGKYALYNSQGLSLYDINNNSSIKLVEVGWQGFIIRNPLSSNIDHKVFYADANGNLNITGIINATGGSIGGWNLTDNELSSGYLTIRGKQTQDNLPGIFINKQPVMVRGYIEGDITKTLQGMCIYNYVVTDNPSIAGQCYNPIVFSSHSHTYQDINQFNNSNYQLEMIQQEVPIYTRTEPDPDPYSIKTYEYICWEDNSYMLYNNNKILYAFYEISSEKTIQTDWLDKVTTTVADANKNINNYVKTENYFQKMNLTGISPVTITLASNTSVFSLNATEGYLSCYDGELGQAIKLLNRQGQESKYNLGDIIVNAWFSGDINHKKLVLVKLNGEKITIPGKDGQGNEVYISAHT